MAGVMSKGLGADALAETLLFNALRDAFGSSPHFDDSPRVIQRVTQNLSTLVRTTPPPRNLVRPMLSILGVILPMLIGILGVLKVSELIEIIMQNCCMSFGAMLIGLCAVALKTIRSPQAALGGAILRVASAVKHAMLSSSAQAMLNIMWSTSVVIGPLIASGVGLSSIAMQYMNPQLYDDVQYNIADIGSGSLFVRLGYLSAVSLLTTVVVANGWHTFIGLKETVSIRWGLLSSFACLAAYHHLNPSNTDYQLGDDPTSDFFSKWFSQGWLETFNTAAHIFCTEATAQISKYVVDGTRLFVAGPVLLNVLRANATEASAAFILCVIYLTGCVSSFVEGRMWDIYYLKKGVSFFLHCFTGLAAVMFLTPAEGIGSADAQNLLASLLSAVFPNIGYGFSDLLSKYLSSVTVDTVKGVINSTDSLLAPNITQASEMLAGNLGNSTRYLDYSSPANGSITVEGVETPWPLQPNSTYPLTIFKSPDHMFKKEYISLLNLGNTKYAYKIAKQNGVAAALIPTFGTTLYLTHGIGMAAILNPAVAIPVATTAVVTSCIGYIVAEQYNPDRLLQRAIDYWLSTPSSLAVIHSIITSVDPNEIVVVGIITHAVEGAPAHLDYIVLRLEDVAHNSAAYVKIPATPTENDITPLIMKDDFALHDSDLLHFSPQEKNTGSFFQKLLLSDDGLKKCKRLLRGIINRYKRSYPPQPNDSVSDLDTGSSDTLLGATGTQAPKKILSDAERMGDIVERILPSLHNALAAKQLINFDESVSSNLFKLAKPDCDEEGCTLKGKPVFDEHDDTHINPEDVFSFCFSLEI